MGGEKKYLDGLVRLFSVLLKCTSDNITLKSLGWIYNNSMGYFELKKEVFIGERNKKRYYLTASEEAIIL